MSNAPAKFNNNAQSPSQTIVLSSAGQECTKHADGNKATLVTRNPAPEASPPASPSRMEKLVVFC